MPPDVGGYGGKFPVARFQMPDPTESFTPPGMDDPAGAVLELQLVLEATGWHVRVGSLAGIEHGCRPAG
jgi:hypothetical protein